MSPQPGETDIPLDLQVDYITFSQKHSSRLKNETGSCHVLWVIYHLTLHGWPASCWYISRDAQHCWTMSNQLFTNESILLKEDCVIILPSLWDSPYYKYSWGTPSNFQVIKNSQRNHLVACNRSWHWWLLVSLFPTLWHLPHNLQRSIIIGTTTNCNNL